MPASHICLDRRIRPGVSRSVCSFCRPLNSREGRGYDRKWRKLSALAIQLHPYCSVCGTTADLTTDHVVPRSRGGVARTLEDVQVLCRSHNASKGARV
jgi:5-methylcytosine-specific restriction endonuclease McrA